MSEVSHHQHAGHAGHQHGGHQHAHGESSGLNAMAASATLHCLTGCAIGEILGLIIGTAMGLSAGWTIALAVGLAFLFGYALSTLPLLKAGLGFFAALTVVLAADTLSIATMEVVDNVVMAVIPGAMDAGLTNPVFWVAMMIALSAAFLAAYPVNKYLLARGKGHALTHHYAHGPSGHTATGVRRLIPAFRTTTLAAVIVAFLVGGLTVALSEELSAESDDTGSVPSSGH
jgi:hypothetical protein